MHPSLQNVLGLLAGLGTSTTRLQRVDDFNAFVLNHIPYGQVSLDSLQTALIEYDGPAAHPAKPPLQWHFGGLPYAINKAVRLNYSYSRLWDGSGSRINASILVGFQANGPSSTYISGSIAPASFADRLNGQITPDTTEQEFATAVLICMPTTVISGSAGFNDIAKFLQNELGEDQIAALKQTLNAFEFDGPAQDNDSHNPFSYTLATLFNNQDKYNQLLWWYFGGKANRVTKAIRIPLLSTTTAGSSPLPATVASVAAARTQPVGRRATSSASQAQPAQAVATKVPDQPTSVSPAQPHPPTSQQSSQPNPAPPPQPQLSLLIGFTGPGTYP
jgi:hypothetical protein